MCRKCLRYWLRAFPWGAWLSRLWNRRETPRVMLSWGLLRGMCREGDHGGRARGVAPYRPKGGA